MVTVDFDSTGTPLMTVEVAPGDAEVVEDARGKRSCGRESEKCLG